MTITQFSLKMTEQNYCMCLKQPYSVSKHCFYVCVREHVQVCGCHAFPPALIHIPVLCACFCVFFFFLACIFEFCMQRVFFPRQFNQCSEDHTCCKCTTQMHNKQQPVCLRRVIISSYSIHYFSFTLHGCMRYTLVGFFFPLFIGNMGQITISSLSLSSAFKQLYNLMSRLDRTCKHAKYLELFDLWFLQGTKDTGYLSCLLLIHLGTLSQLWWYTGNMCSSMLSYTHFSKPNYHLCLHFFLSCRSHEWHDPSFVMPKPMVKGCYMVNMKNLIKPCQN